MTEAQAIDIGRRALACPPWRWPGPLANESRGIPVIEVPVGEPEVVPGLGRLIRIEAIPDFRDPRATGWLLGLVREAWGEPSLSLMPVDESVPLRWSWTDGGLAAPMMTHPVGYREFDSEAEALVGALQAVVL